VLQLCVCTASQLDHPGRELIDQEDGAKEKGKCAQENVGDHKDQEGQAEATNAPQAKVSCHCQKGT